MRIVGVTSHTYDANACYERGGVDTRVDHYLDWIGEAMTAACDDGTRVWCDGPTTGILPPPHRYTPEEVQSMWTLVGGCDAGGTATAVWPAVGALLFAARRSRR
jgi:hypothetical protein